MSQIIKLKRLAVGFKALPLVFFLASFCTAGTLLAAAVAPATSVTPAPAAIATPADVPVASAAPISRSLADLPPAAAAAAAKARTMALTAGERELFFAGCVALGYAERAARVYDEAGWRADHVFATADLSGLELAIQLDPTAKAETVTALLAKGISPQPVTYRDFHEPGPVIATLDQCTPLSLAIDEDKTAAALALIAIGGPQLNYQSFLHGTPLMLATVKDNRDVVASLLMRPEKHSFLNQQAVVPADSYGRRPPFQDGDTALHIAVRQGRYQIATALIHAGINLQLRNNVIYVPGQTAGFTADELAEHLEYYDILRVIRSFQSAQEQARKTTEKAALAEQKARAKAAKLSAKAQPLLTQGQASADLVELTGGGADGGAPALDQRGTGRHRWLPGFLGGDRR